MGFAWQEYWSGLPCFPPGDLLNPRIKPTSPVILALQADFSSAGEAASTGKPVYIAFAISANTNNILISLF